MEIWKTIYDGYQVSNLGRVKSLKNGVEKILKHRQRKGYYLVQLYIEGRKIYPSVHKLVALAFVPNLENKPDINHLNGNKADNRALNLEWCTKSENQIHSVYVLKRGIRTTPVLCLETNEEYRSIQEAGELNNTDCSAIVRCCKGKAETAGGFHWKYAEVG